MLTAFYVWLRTALYFRCSACQLLLPFLGLTKLQGVDHVLFIHPTAGGHFELLVPLAPVCTGAYHRIHVKVRSQLYGVGSRLPSM